MEIVDGDKIYNGHEIFKLVDTHGLPFDIVNLMMRERGMGFNVPEFIEAAYKAGWKRLRIFNTITSTMQLPDNETDIVKSRINSELNKYYGI